MLHHVTHRLGKKEHSLSLFLTVRTISSPNMVWTVWWTILCFWIKHPTNFKIAEHGLDSSTTIPPFLTDFLMRCKLLPEPRASCTQTHMHMLTHDTCSLSSICRWKPWQWTPQLCQALTYLFVFICWVPQITLTLPLVHKWGHFLWSDRLKIHAVSHVLLSRFFPLP